MTRTSGQKRDTERLSSGTYFDMVWETHKIEDYGNGSDLLFVDTVVAHEITTPPAAIRLERDFGDTLFDHKSIIAVNDHVSPPSDSSTAIQAQFLREWAKRHKVRLFDVGDNGIAHVLVAERGLVLPGTLVICGDSHTCTLGALGAVAIGVGSTTQAGAMLAGSIVVERPKVMQIDITGSLPAGTCAKDVALHLVRKLDLEGARGYAIEFTGAVVAALSMDERQTICNMTAEAGATTAIIAPDECTAAYFADGLPQPMIAFDQKKAVYDRTRKIVGSDVMPLITWGTSPAESIGLDGRIPRTASAETLAYMALQAGQRISRIPVQQVFIGSCTNSRLDDLRVAASTLRGRKVRVPTVITPGSQAVKRNAEREGLHEAFQDAGALWTHSSCGPCVGLSMGVIAPEMRCVSTANRNSPGRMGKGGRVHLASPAVASVTAILGRIPTMQEYRSLSPGASCT